MGWFSHKMGPLCEIMGPFCQIMGPSCEIMVPSCEIMVPSCENMVPSCEIMVSSCEIMVPSCKIMDRLCQIIGPFCQIMGPSCDIMCPFFASNVLGRLKAGLQTKRRDSERKGVTPNEDQRPLMNCCHGRNFQVTAFTGLSPGMNTLAGKTHDGSTVCIE